ncbi:MAG: GCN5-related N-acetyltransferase [Ilumatobacteraceae bacterium]|nr:GCN5-related N-acetyltransferase [Ilumatobacteraceae bacterium]
MSIEIRRTAPSEVRAAANVVADALLFPHPTDEEWVSREVGWVEADSVTSWDGARCVGHAGAFRFDTTVPGGRRLDTAGVTRVGVLPTHTRQGLLTSMMTQLLTEGRERGQVLASLRASEAVIYQRFGFEIAGEAVAVKVTSGAVRPLRSATSGSMQILAPTEVLDTVPPIYERCARRTVGSLSRPPFFWTRLLTDAVEMKKPAFVAVHADEHGTPDGYVQYEVQWSERPDGSEIGAGVVHDLFGASGAVELALWSYLLDIDLIREWTSEGRPVDDAIRFAARDTRGYRVTSRWDEQWLRILDVDAALAARTYGDAFGSVVIEVADPMFAANNGTWRITAEGASRTDQPADIVAPIGRLAATYLGGTSWRELADAGLLDVSDDAAVITADALFATHPAPYCGTFF